MLLSNQYVLHPIRLWNVRVDLKEQINKSKTSNNPGSQDVRRSTLHAQQRYRIGCMAMGIGRDGNKARGHDDGEESKWIILT